MSKKKKRSHKYFVNQRYKQKLESSVYAHRTYWSHVKFITKEPDPKSERENPHRFWYYENNLPVEEPDRGKDTYTYYDRPGVPYSIIKYYTPVGYSKSRKFFCRQANKKIRSINSEESYQHNLYKKLYEVRWKLD